MNFFDHQDRARKKSFQLVVYFVAATVLIVISVNLAIAGAFNAVGHLTRESNVLDPSFTHLPEQNVNRPPAVRWWRPDVYVYVTLGTLAVIIGGSLHKIASLSSGGPAVARLLGGRPLAAGTYEADEQKLLNIVEEMSIASGVPMPAVYVMDNEKAINAFAAGFGTNDAVIGVTRGTIEKLNRDELQGVIAHEFSHILNGDMRLNVRLIGLLHGILVIGLIGYAVLRHSPRAVAHEEKSAPAVIALMALGLLIMLIGYAGVFFGRLIQAAVSRQREYLADASAVQFTRNPAGIAGALHKIMQLSQGSVVASPNAPEASHLFFSDAIARGLMHLFATHPPLPDRIRAIDPSFLDRAEVEVQAQQPVPHPGAAMGFAAAQQRVPIRSEQIVERVGDPRQVEFAFANRLLDRLPDEIRRAAHDTYSARALVYCILLNGDEASRQKQVNWLARLPERQVYDEVLNLAPLVQDLGPQARLPLVDVAVGALRGLSPAQMKDFWTVVKGLIEADQRLTLFEYALSKVLYGALLPAIPPAVKYPALQPMMEHIGVVLSALAMAGAESDDSRRVAYQRGMQSLQQAGAVPGMIASPSIQSIDLALNQLAMATPAVKKRVIRACADAVTADQSVRVEEFELLRAVASTLGCPIPPLVAGR